MGNEFMKNRSRTHFLLAAFFCASSTPIMHAAVTLGDVAFVAVPALIGAIAGRESVKNMILADKQNRVYFPLLLEQKKNDVVELKKASLDFKDLKNKGIGALLINAQIIPLEVCMQAVEAGMQRVTREIDELEESIDELHESLAIDPAKRLRNGALIGGAVGAGLGLVACGVVKYEVDRRQGQEEDARCRLSTFHEAQQRKEEENLFNASTQEEKFAFCWLNKINPRHIHTQKEKILFVQEMAEWINLGRPGLNKAEAEWTKQGQPALTLVEGMMKADWKRILNGPSNCSITLLKQ